jgi:dTDP-4-dehydrorhamnose reductase
MNNSTAVELWGGVECTVNRVGNEYFDQLQRNGHVERLSDFDLFAELGARAYAFRSCGSALRLTDWTQRIGLS